jgi:hypothetical protein
VNRRPVTALSVPEVLFALALLSITFVSVLAVLAAGLRADKKGFLKESASEVSDVLQRRLIKEVTTDDPPGTRASFWSTDKSTRSDPFQEGIESSGTTSFEYEICTQTLTPTFGSTEGKRLKQVDIYVHWSSDDVRAGYGSSLHHDRMLLSEASGEEN